MKSILSPLSFLGSLCFTLGVISAGERPLADELAVNASSSSNDDWKFSVGLPGWLAGLKGDIGVHGLTPVHVDVPFKKILQNLDMVAALTLEAQHGPLSFYVDGMYMKLSAGGNPSGPLLNSIDVQQREVLAEVGIAYRLWEGKRGYFDVLAGARYIYMDLNIHLDVNPAGVRDVSREVAGEVVNDVSSAVNRKASAALAEARSAVTEALAEAKSEVSNRALEIKNNARNAIEARAVAKIQSQIQGILSQYPRLPDAVRVIAGSNGPVSDAIKQLIAAQVAAKQADISDDQAALSAQIQASKAAVSAEVAAARAALNEKVQSTKARARAQLNRAVRQAEQNLAKQIETAIRNAVPEHISGSKSWVDPFIGFRARYNITDRLYLTARGDIGGFGISSKLAWQAFGALGYQLNEHLSSELGYRYLSIDYEKGGFVYDAAMGGAFVGLTYRF